MFYIIIYHIFLEVFIVYLKNPTLFFHVGNLSWVPFLYGIEEGVSQTFTDHRY